MKNMFKYMMLAVVAVLGFGLTSCNDDDVTLSRKVLASAKVLEFDGIPADGQIITVTSDGDWVAEAPEWITVSPASGTVGQTEVTITLTDNLRDGALDNPRRANVLFKGRNLESIATVLIRQNGDKYRDPVDYTIDDMEAADDETVVKLSSLIVAAVTGNGFIATDGAQYAYIKEPAIEVTPGAVVTVVGEKFSDNTKMAYVMGEQIFPEGTGVIPSVEPFDISDSIDAITGNKYKLVTVSGAFNGTSVTVEGAKNAAYIIDPLPSMDVNKLTGHIIKVTGYYAGTATPVVNVIPTEIVDLGIDEILYFYEDFEWFQNWVDSNPGKIGETIGTNNNDAACPQSSTQKYEGKSIYDTLLDRGYEILACHSTLNKDGGKVDDRKPNAQLYVNNNYLKFGLTNYYTGIVLPPMEMEESENDAEILFDWCPMRQGSGVYDVTKLVVIVDNGASPMQFPVEPLSIEDGAAFKWYQAQVSLKGATIKKGTKITIRNVDEQWPAEATASTGNWTLRYFLDNIKIRQAK